MKLLGRTLRPDRDTARDGERQKALHKKIFGVARVAGAGQVDFDTLTEIVLATIPKRSRPSIGLSAD
jgi:hypothetical protein